MSATDNQLAVGVPIYSREAALRQFLESVPSSVTTAYIAENGPADQRDRDVYDRSWPFELKVLTLEHDAGIGACRAAIADACSEPYLWVGDCDMAFVDGGDLKTLRAILAANPDLGGVSGWLLEDRAIRAGARDLETVGDSAIKEASDAELEHDPVPFARFDFIPQAGLFRTEIYEDYSYDPDVRSTEHFDFFYAHRQLGAWDFASTPTVLIRHDRNINTEYRESQRGGGHVDRDILAEKWGIEHVEPGARADWATVHDHGLKSDAFNLVKQTTPARVWVPLKRGLERVGL